MKKIALLLGSLFLVTTVAKAQVSPNNIIEEVVWVVGDEPIYRSEVETQIQQMKYDGQKIDGDPYCVIPEMIAVQKLYLHQAKLDTIVVSEGQVNQEVDMRLNYFIDQLGSKEKLEEYFRKPITEIRSELAEYVRNNNIVQEVQRTLVSDIKVTPAEVRKFYNSLPQDSLPTIPMQVEVQIISLYPQVPQQEIDNVKAQLREFSEQVNSGEREFSTLAILHSEDPGSAMRGGELGFVSKATLAPEFAAVAFNLNDPKKVSKIVETEFGYHIIQLIEKRGDQINCRHILLKPHVSLKDVESSVHRLDSVRNDIAEGKFTFEEIVPYISQDKDTRYNKGMMSNNNTGSTRFEMSELPQEIAKAVAKLQVGEISTPITTIDVKNNKEVVMLVKLHSRREAHKADLVSDYQVVANMLEAQKRAQILQDWVEKKRRDTYVRIKEGWRNCDFRYDGWVKEQR
ncbi:MAG: peptidylprolyl isomerase [Bacteroidaceae bacterium]|nr:peptidylprolyl isomerase [Bacteroidaceae bacterium]